MIASTLVATMGGQPQVVTFSLDWLLAQGEQIQEVVVLHLLPRDERLQQAVKRISQEFDGNRYRGRPCRLRLVNIRQAHRKLSDIQNDADAEATWQTVYGLLHSIKNQQTPVHLCIPGGRRMMGLMALSAAMLVFGHQDRVWHIYTPPDFIEQARGGAIMHAGPDDGVQLIQVPLVPWGAYFPALRDLSQPSNQIIAAQTEWLNETERARCQAVISQLTERQTEVLRAFAEGLTPQEVAEQLFIKLVTVDTHKSAILAECRIAWNIPEQRRLTYHFIRDKFGLFLRDTA